jgi:hypothetical protein
MMTTAGLNGIYRKAKSSAESVLSIEKTAEYRQSVAFRSVLADAAKSGQLSGHWATSGSIHTLKGVGMKGDELKLALLASLATFHLHCESRFASTVGISLSKHSPFLTYIKVTDIIPLGHVVKNF